MKLWEDHPVDVRQEEQAAEAVPVDCKRETIGEIIIWSINWASSKVNLSNNITRELTKSSAESKSRYPIHLQRRGLRLGRAQREIEKRREGEGQKGLQSRLFFLPFPWLDHDHFDTANEKLWVKLFNELTEQIKKRYPRWQHNKRTYKGKCRIRVYYIFSKEVSGLEEERGRRKSSSERPRQLHGFVKDVDEPSVEPETRQTLA